MKSETELAPRDVEQERRWITQAMAGDSGAFARLYDSYVDALYRFAYFRVSDQFTAEDLTSQVFLKAWEKLDTYEMRGLPFGAWLFRISRNLIADHFRSHRETTSLDADDAVAVAATDDVDGEVSQKVDTERLLAKLKGLTEEQQQVLMLKFVDGLATDEIAAVMGKNAGAIRALQMRGLQSLAAIIETRHDHSS